MWGGGDGSLIPIFRELGAKEVYAVDPDKENFSNAVKKGLVDSKHVIYKKFEEVPDRIKKQMEVAAVFDFNISVGDQGHFFKSIYESLPENGQLVMTVAEDDVLRDALKVAGKYFHVKWSRIFGNEKENYPHKNLVVCTKLSGDRWSGLKFSFEKAFRR